MMLIMRSVPVGGIIVSVASSEGLGYQPLVSAGATIRFNNPLVLLLQSVLVIVDLVIE